MTEQLASIVAGLSALGDRLGPWIVGMNAWTGAMLLGAAAMDWLLRRRVSAAWRIAIYAAIALRLVLPIGWQTPLGVFGVRAQPISVDPSGAAFTGASQTTIIAGPGQIDIPRPAARNADGAWRWPLLVVAVYAAGIVALVGGAARGRVRLRRLLAQTRAADEPTAALAHPLPVRVHPSAGPMLTGLWRPVLVLPAELASDAGSPRLACIIRHERAHASRRDPWLALAIRAVVVFAWPIVPVWIAGSRMRSLMEQACDERALDGRGAADRRSYAEALIDAAARPSGLFVRPALAGPGLEFGVGLRARIGAMRFTRRWRPALQAPLTVACTAGLLACSGTRGGDDAARGAMQDSGRLSTPEILPWDKPDPIKVEFILLDKWPSFPWLAATPDGRGPANGGIQMLSVGQREQLLDGVSKLGRSPLAAPTIITRPGQQAAITIGEQAAPGEPARSTTIRATPSRNKGGFDVRVEYEETGPDPRSSGPVSVLSIRDQTEIIPIREARPGQGGLLLLVRASDMPPETVRWPIVFYRVNVCELKDGRDFAGAIRNSGGRKLEAGGAGGVAYTIPAELVESLYDKLEVPDMQRFRLGHEGQAQAASGETAVVELTRPGAGDRIRLTGLLTPPADQAGPVQGGALQLGLAWTSLGGVITTPSTQLMNFDAASHQLAIAALSPASPAERRPARLLVVMAHRAGSEEELPRQTMKVEPQTFNPAPGEPTIVVPPVHAPK